MKSGGFTLIEISVVLVLIGLIVGGILVGQDMMKTAAARAQIAQIQKYDSAVNAFKNKYGYLPGDMPDPFASQNGFVARGQYTGEGDGNGLIEGVYGNVQGWNVGMVECAGETPVFWEDLSKANMIEGQFNTANSTNPAAADVTSSGVDNYLPAAKLGNGTYVYVFSTPFSGNAGTMNTNYFGVATVTGIACQTNYGALVNAPAFTVSQAYAIDAKLDDGRPMSGKIEALQVQGTNSNFYEEEWNFGTSPSACFSNQYNQYDTIYYGNSVNCQLAFQMQGAAR